MFYNRSLLGRPYHCPTNFPFLFLTLWAVGQQRNLPCWAQARTPRKTGPSWTMIVAYESEVLAQQWLWFSMTTHHALSSCEQSQLSARDTPWTPPQKKRFKLLGSRDLSCLHTLWSSQRRAIIMAIDTQPAGGHPCMFWAPRPLLAMTSHTPVSLTASLADDPNLKLEHPCHWPYKTRRESSQSGYNFKMKPVCRRNDILRSTQHSHVLAMRNLPMAMP